MNWIDAHKLWPGKITDFIIVKGETYCFLKEEFNPSTTEQIVVDLDFLDIIFFFGFEGSHEDTFSLNKAHIIKAYVSENCESEEDFLRQKKHIEKLKFMSQGYPNIAKFFDKDEFTYKFSDITHWCHLKEEEKD
jgi:hypothetical protein